MKKYQYILLSLMAIVAFGSCNKLANEPDNRQGDVSLKAYLTDNSLTKSAYALNGDKYDFSWVAGDKFVVQTLSGSTYGKDVFAASTGGRTDTFRGTVSDGYTIQNYAFYPNDGATGNTNLNYLNVEVNPVNVDADVSAETATVSLAGTITEDRNYPMAHIPMIGVKDGSGDFAFVPCTGVLMVTINNLPANATSVRLNMIDDNTYALNGSMVFDKNYEIKERYNKSSYKWGQKYLNITHADDADGNGDGYDDSPRSFFFPIPTGTIPAGKLYVTVCYGETVLERKDSKVDIVLTRGTVTEMPGFDSKIVLAENDIDAVITGTSRDPYVTFTFDTAKYDEVRFEHVQTWNDGYVDASSKKTYTSGESISIANAYSVRRTLGWAGYRHGIRRTAIKTVNYYPLNSSDESSFCGSYSGSSTITFAVSDDPSAGNVMITYFDGVSADINLYGSYSGGTFTASPAQWKASKFGKDTSDNDLVLASGKYSDEYYYVANNNADLVFTLSSTTVTSGGRLGTAYLSSGFYYYTSRAWNTFSASK